jgi:hypothetical protein
MVIYDHACVLIFPASVMQKNVTGAVADHIDHGS